MASLVPTTSPLLKWQAEQILDKVCIDILIAHHVYGHLKHGTAYQSSSISVEAE